MDIAESFMNLARKKNIPVWIRANLVLNKISKDSLDQH